LDRGLDDIIYLIFIYISPVTSLILIFSNYNMNGRVRGEKPKFIGV